MSRRVLLVLATSVLVHQSAAEAATPKGKGGKGAAHATTGDVLPVRVRETIALIRDAAEARDIEVLRDAVDWNEMKPDFGPGFGADGSNDPIAHFKRLTPDGSGRDILDVLVALLDGPPAVQPYGRDIENNRLFVWPRFSESSPAGLAGDDLALFERLVAAADRDAMRAAGRYTGWRLVLGADGTWHTFLREK